MKSNCDLIKSLMVIDYYEDEDRYKTISNKKDEKSIISPLKNDSIKEKTNDVIEVVAVAISPQRRKEKGIIIVEEEKKKNNMMDPVPKIPLFVTEEDEMREKELLKNSGGDMNISPQAHQVS